jgi:hypothetical protein
VYDGVELVVVVVFSPCTASEAPVERVSAEREECGSIECQASLDVYRGASRGFFPNVGSRFRDGGMHSVFGVHRHLFKGITGATGSVRASASLPTTERWLPRLCPTRRPPH